MIDEYERAIFDLKNILQNVSEEAYEVIVDNQTKDEDCRSIQTIMKHVVRAGYGYANYTREQLQMDFSTVVNKEIKLSEIISEVDKMFAYTLETFEGRWETIDQELDKIMINSRWGTVYNLDQMLEHAIVHILRHRRQIEKFLLKIQS